MDHLDDFLKGSEEPAIAEETAEQPESLTQPEETPVEVVETPEAGPVRDEKGRFAPKGEPESASPAPVEEPELDHAALIGERRRRQQAEERLQALEAQLQAQPAQPAPDMFEDPDAWQQQLSSNVVSTAVQQATLNARLDMSEMMVRQSHTDFEDKKATFLQLMADTPGLQQKAMSDPHPWNFAYNYVTNHQRMNELAATNVAELEAKIRAEIEAKYAPAPTPETPPIPDTLADAQSARGGSSQALNVPSFDQILARK